MNVCAFKIESIPALRAELLGGVCSAGNLAVGGYTPVLALCRELLAAGFDPSTPLEVYRGDNLALQVRSIGEAEGPALLPSERCAQPRPSRQSLRGCCHDP